MPKALKVAGEVDSWCTSCRMMLNHRIISMVGPKPHQVECLTCHKSHLYKAHPPGEKPAPGVVRGKADSGPRPARVSHVTKAEQARLTREQSWEKAINGRGMNDFKSYNVSAVFNEGDVIRHKKFGEGVVTRVIDAQKIEVLFRDEPRTLAHNLAS